MSYKDENLLDKIWGTRYSLIWVVWFVLALKLGMITAAHYGNDSWMPALPILGVMGLGLLFQKFKLLGED